MGFSVLMSVYKKEQAGYLSEAMESVFNQSLVPDEVVLMEDGPLTDELEQTISELKKRHPQIVTFSFAENVQLGRALAKGVELCSHELIARMDTDDIAVYDRFRHQHDYMTAHPTVAVCGGWMQEFNDEGTYSRRKQMPQSNEEIRRYGKYRNPVNHMTVMFRRQAVLTAGNYRHMPMICGAVCWCGEWSFTTCLRCWCVCATITVCMSGAEEWHISDNMLLSGGNRKKWGGFAAGSI